MATKKKAIRRQTRALYVEGLEQRMLLAGDVVADLLLDGTLQIVGDRSELERRQRHLRSPVTASPSGQSPLRFDIAERARTVARFLRAPTSPAERLDSLYEGDRSFAVAGRRP